MFSKRAFSGKGSLFNRRSRFAVKWRRAGWGLRLSVFAACLGLFVFLVFLQQSDTDSAEARGSFVIYSLVNLNFILLLVFAFLIGRNLVKLLFDRKRNIFGSKLRSRLVGAFVSLVLIPSVFIFLFASGLITQVMEGWFSEPIETAIAGSVDIAKTHFQVSKKYLQAVSDDLNQDLAPRLKTYLSDKPTKEAQEKFTVDLDRLRKNWGLFSLRIVRKDGTVVLEAFNPTSTIENFAEPDISLDIINELAATGDNLVQLEERESRQFLRCYKFIGDKKDEIILVASFRITPEMTQTMESINSSYRHYEELKYYKGLIKSSNVLTLALFTALLLFSAIWLAFYLARDLTIPMMRLAEATRSVAQGKFDFSLKEQGDDELGILVQSFNQMTEKLRSTQAQSEQRRSYLEAVLGSLAVSVFSLDSDMRVVALNNPASTFVKSLDADSAVGKVLWDILPQNLSDELKTLIGYQPNSAEEPVHGFALEKQMSLDVKGQRLELLATLARIVDKGYNINGYVLLIDDLTDLARAQQSAAWREVAQRVAHEIKNPLTPIQISAQRLQRMAESFQPAAKIKVEECCNAILENVTSIKKLTDEFRRYARMPTPEFCLSDLNVLLTDTVQSYAAGDSTIQFKVDLDKDLPKLMLDPEQIRRCIINLIDNAVQSVSQLPDQSDGIIEVQSDLDRSRNKVVFSVSDNGTGVPHEIKAHIFEPHVTSRPEGSGLGLAIVSSILADHEGTVRAQDNAPRGAKFIVELPVNTNLKTVRKIG